MKIIQVVSSLDFGGLEKMVIQLTERLNQTGSECSIVCLEKEGGLVNEALRKNIQVDVFSKKDGFDMDLIWNLKKYFQREEADIVHTHNFAPLIYASTAAKLAGVPCMNTRHGRADKKAPWIFWALNKKIAAVSNDAKEQLLKNNRIKSEKVKVVYNGIDIQSMRADLQPNEKAQLRQSLGIKADSFVIGNIGRLVREKDQATLLKAFRKISQRTKNVELLIVGDGPLKSNLLKLAKELDIQGSVKFAGFREDIAQMLQIMDVFVLSSIMEGISLTVLEAMAAGLPVVATKVGGNPEIISEGKTGFLVPLGYPERIESAVKRIMADPRLGRSLGEAGRLRVQENSQLEHMVSVYREIYDEIKSEKG
ncbi:MAG: glycosyltransferase [Candidatus Omnitrophica bacterium]|nr:glycosyltransferase [Candidatus Omnitrophota bacterium]